MIKTFISYDNLHKAKKHQIQQIIKQYPQNFQDVSLDYTLDLDTNEAIRQKIRDDYITDATVLILIATKDAKGRKFIDWEIAAAMYDGSKRLDGRRNDICGIVVVDYVDHNIHTGHDDLKKEYEYMTGPTTWTSISDQKTRDRYDYLPNRIVESIIKGADITIIPSIFANQLLPIAIINAHNSKRKNIGKYIFNDLKSNNSPRKEYSPLF